MARADIALNDAQLPLVASVAAAHQIGGKRIRALLRKAIADNGISQTSLARELEMDEAHLSRVLADDKGAHPSPAVYAAVFALDAKGILIAGLASMCGRDAVERRPDPEAENRRLREKLRALRAEVDAVLGEDAP